jgi:hypothetical protein
MRRMNLESSEPIFLWTSFKFPLFREIWASLTLRFECVLGNVSKNFEEPLIRIKIYLGRVCRACAQCILLSQRHIRRRIPRDGNSRAPNTRVVWANERAPRRKYTYYVMIIIAFPARVAFPRHVINGCARRHCMAKVGNRRSMKFLSRCVIYCWIIARARLRTWNLKCFWF